MRAIVIYQLSFRILSEKQILSIYLLSNCTFENSSWSLYIMCVPHCHTYCFLANYTTPTQGKEKKNKTFITHNAMVF